MLPIHDRIACIPACDEPLSAEIGVVRGDSCSWLFDVGNGAAPLAAVQAIPGKKCAVLSHFHPDHMANWESCGLSQLFASEHTRRYLPQHVPFPVTIITEPLLLCDGAELRLFPLPSSHARGCLGLEVDDAFAFVGDGLYCTGKDGRPAFNAGMLRETLAVLRTLRADTLLVSHHEPFARSRADVLAELEAVYAARDPHESYIFV